VYEVNPLIVVKVPKPGIEEREQFRKEVEIVRILSYHPPCPQLVSCFLFGIFWGMRGICLSMSFQAHHARNPDRLQATQVTEFEHLRPKKGGVVRTPDYGQRALKLGILPSSFSLVKPEMITMGMVIGMSRIDNSSAVFVMVIERKMRFHCNPLQLSLGVLQ
jgi:hypothetical protein